MGVESFLIPGKAKVAVFVALFFVTFQLLLTLDIPIFPCTVGPVFPSEETGTMLRLTTCSLVPKLGVRITLLPEGLLMLFVILIVIPYLIACSVGSLTGR